VQVGLGNPSRVDTGRELTPQGIGYARGGLSDAIVQFDADKEAQGDLRIADFDC
jgi:hypothetical protein